MDFGINFKFDVQKYENSLNQHLCMVENINFRTKKIRQNCIFEE